MSPPAKSSSLFRPSTPFADDSLNSVTNDASSGDPAKTEPRVLKTLSRYEEVSAEPITNPAPPLRANFFGTSPSFGQRSPFPLDPSSLRYNPNGTLESGTLRVDTTINGAKFPKGTRIRLHENGSLRFGVLRSKQKIQGILCGPGHVWFHPNGKLSQAKLHAPLIIQGIHCDKGDVWFHDNGRLALASLAKNQNIQGTPCLRGDVWFYRNSVLSQATLAGTQTLRGLPLSGNTSLSFHQNGAFRSGTLSKDLKIQGKGFVAGDTVRFKSDGVLN